MQNTKKLYIETYGCQMNVADSEVVVSVLKNEGYQMTDTYEEADLILVNTCSVRESAEQRVLGRLDIFRKEKVKRNNIQIGVIGCMAERMGETLYRKNKKVDIIAGPDAYRSLPDLLKQNGKEDAINVELSRTETYEGICPERIDNSGVSAYISIMRGCNNFCTYCVVPNTRGRERSRSVDSIINELQTLQENNYKEVTLLGQNVNSYDGRYNSETIDFPRLLQIVAEAAPEMRIRFTTSHPKDLSDALLSVMASYENIANHVHLPLQSGSNQILKKMNRKYTREWYLDRIAAIQSYLPDSGITTDVFVGFCSETEEDHRQTVELMKNVAFDFAFMFKYSQRPGTYAYNYLEDDVPEDTKKRRLQEIIDLQQENSEESNKNDVGKTFTVLITGPSKKSDRYLAGRNPQSKVIVFPAKNYQSGTFVKVKVQDFTKGTLIGEVVG